MWIFFVDFFVGETPGNFNLVIVNDALDKAYALLKTFIVSEFDKIGVCGESSCGVYLFLLPINYRVNLK